MIRPVVFARVSLALTALAFGGFGVWLLIWPQAIELVGVSLPGPSGRAEIRAFYGGMELGIAAFFVLAATRPSWFKPALFLQVAALGGLGIGRIFGIAAEAAAEPLHFILAAIELTGAAIGALALRQLAKASQQPG